MPKRMRDLPAEYMSFRRAHAIALGARLRQRREALGLTQDQLRARMELEQVFVSRTQYSRIEVGESLPDTFVLSGLRAVLGVSCDWLVEGNDIGG